MNPEILHPDPQEASKRSGTNVINQDRVRLESLETDVHNKIDRRLKKVHTFTTTSEETITHKLDRIPADVICGVGTANATIRKGSTAWTDSHVYLISSAQPNTVMLYFI